MDRPFPPDAAMTPEEIRAADARLDARGTGTGGSARRFGEDGDSDWEPSVPDPLSPQRLSALRPHVVNLRQGGLSGDGRFSTTPADVDAIFGEWIPAWARTRSDGAVRILLWAHGGLVDERSGLLGASANLQWWMAHGVYPIHFVWETGFLETIGQLLDGARDRSMGARDLWDVTLDPVVEFSARLLGGPTIWSGMKRSAERSFLADGGGLLALQRLRQAAQSLAQQGLSVSLHAVGHSAGAIFHSHLLPRSAELGLPAFDSLSLLAPAITVDDFMARVAPLVGSHVRSLRMFTMRRELEQADSCGPAYHKSLLYLIHHALEPVARTPILGLEDSVRADRRTSAIFGLGADAGLRRVDAEVVWSITTRDASGRPDAASASTSHGGFDDDPSTLSSVLHRILDRPADSPPPGPADVDASRFAEREGWSVDARIRARAEALGLRAPAKPLAARPAEFGAPPSTGGRRTALCIGIDAYPQSPLGGCVADARLWAATFGELGFEVEPLLCDQQATRSEILRRMRAIVNSARTGDVVAIQYSGHGTMLPDEDLDEADGDTPVTDEAIVPVDFALGQFVVDDELAGIFAAAAPGVSLFCFFDCCHSGTINRVAAWRGASAARDAGLIERRIQPSREIVEQYLRLRRADRAARGVAARGPLRDVVAGPEVSFAACRSGEKAFESGGQGHFTRHATNVLRRGVGGLTSESFIRRVVDEFGPARSQNPEINCAPGREKLALLAPLGAAAAVSGGPGLDVRRAEVLARVRALLEELE